MARRNPLELLMQCISVEAETVQCVVCCVCSEQCAAQPFGGADLLRSHFPAEAEAAAVGLNAKVTTVADISTVARQASSHHWG